MLIEKSLEKKDQMESKKRESIMVVRGCPPLNRVYGYARGLSLFFASSR